MPINDALLPEYDHEMGTTRRLLERVPEDALGWKPHEKSMTLGQLAGHLARLSTWTGRIIGEKSVDMAAARAQPRPAPPTTRGEILRWFDESTAEARAILAPLVDEDWLKPWSLKQGTAVVFTMPKATVFRSFVLNHTIHHRGQLSVYLRLRDVPLPSIYGPTADEP